MVLVLDKKDLIVNIWLNWGQEFKALKNKQGYRVYVIKWL